MYPGPNFGFTLWQCPLPEGRGSRASHVGRLDSTRVVRPYLGLMDVDVLPSLREGFPNVVFFQASAMAIPTVTTDATGAVESERLGETGLVVPAQGGEAFAGVGSQLRDASRRLKMGHSARQWVGEAFSPTSVVASLLGPRTSAASRPSRGR